MPLADITFACSAVRDAVAAVLEADPLVAESGATIVARKRGQLISEIQAKVASLKLSIVVMQGEVVKVNPHTEPPVIEEMRVHVVVGETRLNNGIEGEQLAELLLRLLHNTTLTTLGPETRLFADEGSVKYDEEPKAGLTLTIITFNCTGLPAQLP